MYLINYFEILNFFLKYKKNNKINGKKIKSFVASMFLVQKLRLMENKTSKTHKKVRFQSFFFFKEDNILPTKLYFDLKKLYFLM